MPKGEGLGTGGTQKEGSFNDPGHLVPIGSLKELVLSRFPEGHPLRDVILAERDYLAPGEFLAKMEIWGVLLRRRP